MNNIQSLCHSVWDCKFGNDHAILLARGYFISNVGKDEEMILN